MNENENKTFADVIVELRKEKGFTQQDLANKLHITDKAVSKWERGLSLMDISLLKPLSEILDVSVSELLNGQRMENVDNDIINDTITASVNTYTKREKKKLIKKTFIIIFIFINCKELINNCIISFKTSHFII